jgi:hypothetical protein
VSDAPLDRGLSMLGVQTLRHVRDDVPRFFQSEGRSRDEFGRDSTDLRLEAFEAAAWSEEASAGLLAEAAALDLEDGVLDVE